ncbi:MAG: DUF3427 domain-containing protein [Pseudomonadota bacterium]
MDILETRVSHLQAPLPSQPDVPLQIHARYTRVEILAAFGSAGEVATPEWREGVKWLPDAKTDLLAFTLDKSVGHFSPTTRYKDYAISPSLIHWESQSRTREDSETGQRYQFHAARGSSILLFARLNTDERAFWFLGPATYVKHESDADGDHVAVAQAHAGGFVRGVCGGGGVSWRTYKSGSCALKVKICDLRKFADDQMLVGSRSQLATLNIPLKCWTISSPTPSFRR